MAIKVKKSNNERKKISYRLKKKMSMILESIHVFSYMITKRKN